jgi:tetratricopeptide (TPR) repeat protein
MSVTMGKLIICNGKQAEKPFYFKLTNTYIYSLEELCYFIYHNVDTITVELYQDSFLHWLEHEISLPELRKRVEELVGPINKQGECENTENHNHTNLKDIIVTILCSSDYYEEQEIKQLLFIMEQAEQLTPFEKLKKKADNCLKYSQFTQAAKEYERILSSTEVVNLRKDEYGDLKHNLALAKLHMTGPAEALRLFKEAYDNNQNKESLRQYFLTLLLSKQEEVLKVETEKYGITEELRKSFEIELEESFKRAKTSADYDALQDLKECKDTGKITKFYQTAEEITLNFKQEFRLENS